MALKSLGPYNIHPEPENYTQRKVVIFSDPHKFACSMASLAKILGTSGSELIQHGVVTGFYEDDGTQEMKGNDESIYTF